MLEVTMASPSAILAASKSMPGGGRPNPGPQQQQGPYIGRMSPLVQQLNNEHGYANTYGGFLPRPPQTFTDGAFSPFSPIMPVPIDAPPPGFERPEPRRFAYEVGYNLPIGDPGTEGGYKLAPFSVLKSLSKNYSIARRCIQLVKKEVCGLDWDITLTSHAEKAYQGDHEAQRDFGERRAKAMRFFRKPDPNYFDFTSWMSAMLEQILTIDALSLYLCPKKGTGMGRGLLGSDLDGLWCIDGATIRPLLNLHGGMPVPPAPAYQQYEYGVPRADFTTVMAGLDLPEIAGGERGAYRGDQLVYLPMCPFPDSPYGFSPTEQALVPILTGLRKQGYQLEFFTEGTVPAVYISPGDTSMTPNQVRELQDALNAVANDQAFHWKVIVLPPGSKTMPQKPNDIVDQSDEWIANEVCMMYGVSPMDVGILPKVSTVASPFAAREMAQASRTNQEKTDTTPLLKFIASIPNFILQIVCDQPDMEFSFEGMREVQDEAALTDTYVKQAQIGVRSVDEFRDKIGLPPWGLDETSGPLVFTPMGPIPLSEAVSIAQAQAQAKALPPGSSGAKKPAVTAKPLPSGTVTGRQRARGGAALTPAHAASEGFMPERSAKKPSAGPAHAQASVKATLAELEALTRHLRKGRLISTWEARHLEPRALSLIAEQMAKGMDAEQAAGLVKTIVLPPASYQWAEKARHEQSPQAQIQAQQLALEQEYTRRIEAAFASAAAAAAKLIAAWGAGTLAVTTAVLAGLIAAELRKALTAALSGLWADAWAHGEAEAGGSAGGALEAFLGTVGRQVQEWVSETNVAAIIADLRDLAGLKRKALIAALLRLLKADERAELIAVTELMRAWNQAVLAVWKLLGVTYKGWQTRNDAKVCFPAGTPVATPTGEVPIERLKPGDLVITPEGQRPVIATMERLYTGGLTVIQAEGRTVTATDNHRFMTTNGWRKAADLKPGDLLKSLEDESAEIGSVVHFSLAQPDDVPAEAAKFRIADGVLGRSPLVPVLAVGLNGDGETGEREVDRPAAHVKFGRELKAQQGERLTDAELQHGLARKLAVATAGAELPIGSGKARLRAEGDTARLAGEVDRWPAAFLGTEPPVEMLLSPETRSAAVTVDVLGLGSGTCPRARPVALGGGLADGEVLAADNAGLRDLATVLVARPGAVDLGLVIEPAGAEDDAAARASAFGVDARSGVIALVGAEDSGAPGALSTHDDFAALGALVSEWHGQASPIQAIIVNHPLTVYNVSVETEPVYYASRFLVHNCGECKANQAAGSIPVGARFPSGDLMPPGHPRCRCHATAPPPGWTPPVTAANKKRKRGVNLDGEVVLADAKPGDENPAGGGGRTLYPHRPDGTEVPGGVPGASAGGEPPRWDASTPERRGYVNTYGEDDGDWPEHVREVAPRPDQDYPDGGGEDEDLWPEGGHGTAQPPVTSIGGGPRGRAPNAVGKAADAAAQFLKDAPKAKASAVRKLMQENFPPDALAWVGRATWVGPVEIPLELMDLSGRKGWAASHQQGHVKAIARDLKAGRKVNEIIGVLRPGHNHVRLVDGRHRTLACEKNKMPVRGYVGFLDRDSDLEAAYDTYHQQHHFGDSPKNKAAGYDLSPRSGMISLDLPEGLIQPVPGGVDDHHVTVAYLGKDVDDRELDIVLAQARTAARHAPGPLAGMLSGIGSFPPSDGSDGMVPAFVPARIPGAEKLRADLEHLSASEHKDWAPHVTLAYLQPGEPLPAPHPPVPVTFTHLSVHRGDEVYRFPLGGE
jgi:2'-5' RNA ligase